MISRIGVLYTHMASEYIWRNIALSEIPIGLLTCDYNNNYKSGDRVPTSDCRFYTENDLLVRFGKILENNNCYIEGEIDYSAPNDFVYEGILYCFATLVFKKRIWIKMIKINIFYKYEIYAAIL